MRRAAQHAIEQSVTERLPAACVEGALEEMLLRGGRLNARLLGFDADRSSTQD